MQYRKAVFVCRAQPPHWGHIQTIKFGLTQADEVLLFLGGAGGARRPRNPWSFQERAEMVRRAIGDDDSLVTIVPIADQTYNDTAWVERIQAEVATHERDNSKVCLLGRKKDGSGYYLDLFPQWASIAPQPGELAKLNATDIRQALLFSGEVPGIDVVPLSVCQFLTEYMATPEAQRMRDEVKFIADYKRHHDDGLYHRNNVAADAVVVQGGHILLVRRKSLPGKGKLALPGGHLNRDETAVDACIRELREETGIKVPEPALRGSIESHRVFDDPYRSDLCRTFSFTYLIRLKNEKKGLAKLRPGSDAESAFWLPINDLRESEMFDDHYHIIRAMLGLN